MALIRRLTLKPARGAVYFSHTATTHTPVRDELKDLTFTETKEAFKSKKTSELARAYFVYQICSINWIVERNEMIMKRAQQIMGKTLFGMLMKATFYGQFVAGEDTVKIKPVVERLKSFGVKSILDYSVEEDLSHEEAEDREIKAATPQAGRPTEVEDSLKQYQLDQNFADRRYLVHSARTFFYLNEASCEKNMEAFLRSIQAVHDATKSTGLMGIKLTALGRPQLLMQLSEVIMRARNYMHQIGGGTGNVLMHHKTIEDFQRYFGEHKDKPDVKDFLKNVNADKKGIINLFPWSEILDEDMDMSSTFRVPDPKTGQMRRLTSQISVQEQAMFRNMMRRLKILIEAADALDVRVMIDAEQSYFQPAISRICMEMMRKYNKDKFLVFNTYQTYMKRTYSEVIYDLEQAQRQNFYWAAKCVRGAYLEQERARAQAMGYEDPTCENFEATSASFHKVLMEIINRAHSGPQKGKVGVMVASHNEDTVRYAINIMKDLNIKPEEKVVCFGQLLGMCDHMTFPLGQAGYSAYKYVPYGPVVEVLPYLSRRAYENRGFLTKIKKEKQMLLKEIIRRMFTGNLFHKPEGKYTPV